VTGPAKQPLFVYLTEQGDASLRREVAWNFEKFVIGRDGKLVARFPSKVTPDSLDVTRAIEAEISKKPRP